MPPRAEVFEDFLQNKLAKGISQHGTPAESHAATKLCPDILGENTALNQPSPMSHVVQEFVVTGLSFLFYSATYTEEE